jgi:hypothetical protein
MVPISKQWHRHTRSTATKDTLTGASISTTSTSTAPKPQYVRWANVVVGDYLGTKRDTSGTVIVCMVQVQ